MKKTKGPKMILKPSEGWVRFAVQHLTSKEEIQNLLLEEFDIQDTDQSEDELELVDSNKTLEMIYDRFDKFRKQYGSMTIELSGVAKTGQVFLFGKELSAAKSLAVRNHSPSGFAWGYSGSGPAQLALAICIELFGIDKADYVYQKFKVKYIATIPQGDFNVDIDIKSPSDLI